jgi:hypothetical protein
VKKKVIVLLTAALILLYTIMLINTNSVVNDVRNIMLGNVEKSVTDNTPLRIYNFSNVLSNAEVEVRISRIFVLHNFFDGFVWVNYSYETLKNDSDMRPGSANVFSRWKIHRENGRWEVAEIKENP